MPCGRSRHGQVSLPRGYARLPSYGGLAVFERRRPGRRQQRGTALVVDTTGRPILFDFGLISATHRDIAEMLEKKTFRQDLFYRIRGLRITLPPLREREDVRELIEHFLAKQQAAGRRLRLSPEAEHLLLVYHWPGNIRELQQMIAVASAMTNDGGVVLPEHLPDEITERKAKIIDDDHKSLARHERGAVTQAMEENARNVSAAARSLGIARTTLYRKLRSN